MFATREKTILVDCDGVLLDWEYAFHVWMERHGYKADDDGFNIYNIHERYSIEKPEGKKLVRMFNESAAIGYLPPLRDAIHYVRKLHEEHGYVFHAITSLSTDPAAGALRTRNLQKLFGETAFERFVYLDTGADKDQALAEYKNTGCWWVEDKPENADIGWGMGLNSVLIRHGHNAGYDGMAIDVDNWKELYNIIVGE